MYEEHPRITPPHPNAILWRYMDFTKYVSLLDRNALFFGRVDKLGDPFEGSIPERNIPLRREGFPDFSEANKNRFAEHHGSLLKDFRKSIVVNCWHHNNIESDFMWKVYARQNEGVAIVTNTESLSRSFKCDNSVYVGSVKYIDYNTEVIREDNMFPICLHKRKSFKHENEVRALASYSDEELSQGKYCDVDLSILIHKVCVAPYVKDWFLELVRCVTDRYRLDVPVCRSTLAGSPVF